MHISRRAVLAASVLAPGVASAATLQPHSFEELLRNPVVTDAAISPDGEQLAVLRQQTTGEVTRAFVTLNKTRDMDAPPVVVDVGEYQVDQVEWAKNDRLLIWVTLWKDNKGRPYGISFGGWVFPIPMRRVISIGVDGSGGVVLFNDAKGVIRRTFDAANIVDVMHGDPRLVLMQAYDPGRDANALYQVDVYNGHATPLERGSSTTAGWLTQRGVPMLRMDANRRGTVMSVFARAPGETGWKLIRKVRQDEFQKLPDFDVVGATTQAGVFLVSRRAEGEDVKKIRTFDIRTLEFGAVVGEPPPRDAEAAVIDENLALVAIASRIDRLEYQFSDPTLAAHYRAVSRALKDSSNVRLYDISLDHKRMLLKATGPQEPGAFHLYDRDSKRLHMVSVTTPWLAPERLAAMETLSVRTRDGAQIVAYLSIPAVAGKGPLPLVVMPHGGPEVRDVYDFDPFAQALASKGWLVLQPNFRGSGGYGQAFAAAGHRRWGDRMQQDVEDAVAQVMASGRVDPRRVAICGASYGGYAALMGPILRRDLYRCAVSISGVTDLLEIMKYEREDGEDSPSYRHWLELIGDPKTDAEMLRKASPRLRAAELSLPVLLIHGGGDTVVPPSQSQLMAEALKLAGKYVQHVEMKGEGHNGWSRDTWKSVFEKTTSFIGAAFG